MPIWLRKFTYSQILEVKKREAEAYKKASSPQGNKTKVDLTNPDKNQLPQNTITPPSYITKASKK